MLTLHSVLLEYVAVGENLTVLLLKMFHGTSVCKGWICEAKIAALVVIATDDVVAMMVAVLKNTLIVANISRLDFSRNICLPVRFLVSG